MRSHRVGAFRIIYRLSKTEVEVVFIEHRKDVYR